MTEFVLQHIRPSLVFRSVRSHIVRWQGTDGMQRRRPRLLRVHAQIRLVRRRRRPKLWNRQGGDRQVHLDGDGHPTARFPAALPRHTPNAARDVTRDRTVPPPRPTGYISQRLRPTARLQPHTPPGVQHAPRGDPGPVRELGSTPGLVPVLAGTHVHVVWPAGNATTPAQRAALRK